MRAGGWGPVLGGWNNEIRHVLRTPIAAALGRGFRTPPVPGGARAGRARRQTRHRLRVGSRAPLPGGIFAFLRARDLPRRLLAAHTAYPAGARHRVDAAEIQSSRACG